MPIKKIASKIINDTQSNVDAWYKKQDDQDQKRQEYLNRWNTDNIKKEVLPEPLAINPMPVSFDQLNKLQLQKKENDLAESAMKKYSFNGDIANEANKMKDQLNQDIGSVTSMWVNTKDFGQGVYDEKTQTLSPQAKLLAYKIWQSRGLDPKQQDQSAKDAVKYMLGSQYMDKVNDASDLNFLFDEKQHLGLGDNTKNLRWLASNFSKGLGNLVRFAYETPNYLLAGSKYLQGEKKEAAKLFNYASENVSRPFFGSISGDIKEMTPDEVQQAAYDNNSFLRVTHSITGSLGQMGPALIATMLTGGAASAALRAGARATAGGVVDAAALEGAEAIGARVASGIATEASGGYAATELGAMPALVNNTSRLVNLTSKIGTFASESLPNFISSKAKDAALTTLTFGGIQLDGDYQEGLNKGLTGEDLAAYTLKRTATSLAIEAISVPFVPARWIPEGNIVKNILNGEKKQWTKAAFELGEGFFGEGAEEVLDKMKNDYFDSQMQKADYQKQLELYKNGQLTTPPVPPKEYNIFKSFGSTAEDFLVGGISGMLFKAGPAINVLNAPMQGNALYKATQDMQAFNNKVDKMLGEGKLDKDQADSLKGFVATIQPHVKAAENKKLEGISATQWAIESAKLNEVASMMTDPNWTATATEEEKQDAINLAQSASVNMKMLEKGYWLKDKAVNAEQINAISKFETPANQYTEEQRDAISRIGLFETKTIDLKSGNTVAPKQADGTFDNTIPQMAQQMRDGKMVFENTTGLPPVLDHAGNVIDGKKRMAKALSEGATKMDVLVPVPIQKVEQQMTDALNNGVGVSLNTNAIKQYDPETQRLIKDISAQFIQLSQTEIDKAREQDRTAAELKGTAFEAPSNVNQVTRPWYWAINQLTQAGIPEQQIPGIVAAMVGNNVSEGAIKSFMEAHKSTFAKPTRIAKVAPTSTNTTQQAPTATSVADQIRDLTNRLDEGGLSKSEAKDIKRQITELKKSDKISNFTKIVNELESKGIAQRLDKNCP